MASAKGTTAKPCRRTEDVPAKSTRADCILKPLLAARRCARPFLAVPCQRQVSSGACDVAP
eukprot:9691627-Alexandrium_andersonii.AAC.1